MWVWLRNNIGSIAVVLFLLAVISLIIRRLILDRKAGRQLCGGACGSCGGGCAGCPMHGRCHAK